MFMVQSGPIRRSLVALSTATVAEEEEEKEEEDIVFLPLSLSETSSRNTTINSGFNDPKLRSLKKMKTFQQD